jgi:hypothetical protein
VDNLIEFKRVTSLRIDRAQLLYSGALYTEALSQTLTRDSWSRAARREVINVIDAQHSSTRTGEKSAVWAIMSQICRPRALS